MSIPFRKCIIFAKNKKLGKKILICPLNWGLGHATRCVPIIKALVSQKHRVIIAADEGPLAFLQKEFPDMDFIKFPGFSPRYSRSNSQVLKLLSSFPGALRDFRRDHKTVEQIVKNRNIELVISDNRFGCWSKQVPTIFITHQLHIQVPRFWKFAAPIVKLFNNSYLRKFDKIWVPDEENEPSLAGKLSHPAIKRFKTEYMGFLSRFHHNNQEDTEKDNKYLVILSGPEPQRTMFEDIVLEQAAKTKDNILILRAKPDSYDLPHDIPENVSMFNHVDDELFVELVNSAENIICRGGYSSLMDLVRLGRNAYLVPTPGQTEQEFLAQHLTELGYFNWCKQSEFQLDKVMIPKIDIREKYNDDEHKIEDFIQTHLTNI